MQRLLLSALLVAGALTTACNQDDDDTAAPAGNGGGGGGGTTTITAATVESATYTVDGVARTHTSGSGNAAIIFSNSGSSGSPTSTKTYGCTFYDEATDETYIEFSLGQFEQAGFGIPADDVFFGWFNTGEIPYATAGGQFDKAEIHMYDGAPLFTEWSSRCGAQDGESFNVTQIVEIPNSITYDRVKYRVTFSCKLYNCSGSAVRTITNGTAVVTVENNV
ncbi:MAG: hypothetical protein JNM62_11130 [Flavobacteriales bacterium]|nr:hypothetical protein [Flavobacteriales bacterium]